MVIKMKIIIEDKKVWRNEKGELHREDGPAIEYNDGAKSWWVNGKRHRENGPAIIFADGSRQWYIDGKIHRIDGPAIELANERKEWWFNDKRINCQFQEEFEKIISLLIFE